MTGEGILKRMNEEKEKVAKLWINPIPGLILSDVEKDKIKNSFQSWSTPFQRFLFEEGIDGLIEKYKNVLHNVKTQTCPHTKDGSLNTGDAYFACCGISYEYYNDISVRRALQIIIDSVNEKLQDVIANKIEEIDSDLKDLIMKNEANDNPSLNEESNWWSNYLPFGVKP